MFINKLPSRAPRVLNSYDCPPHGVLHYVDEYPTYYDTIYYPELYIHHFLTPETCAAWLQDDLNSHLNHCRPCRLCAVGLQILVDWVNPAFLISVKLQSLELLPSELEDSRFSRCSIISQLSLLDKINSERPVKDHASLANEVPQWLTSTDEHYRQLLLTIPSASLRQASSKCSTRLTNPRMDQKKESYISNILADISAQRLHLMSIDPVNFSLDKPKFSRRHLFAEHFKTSYGDVVGSLLQELPYKFQQNPDISLLKSLSKELLWVAEPLDSLVERIEKAFKTDVLIATLRKIPIHRRPALNAQSRRKTANSVVHHIQCRVSYLNHLSDVALYEHILSFFPKFDTMTASNAQLIKQIVCYEYGNAIESAISTSLTSRQQLRDKAEATRKRVQRLRNKKDKMLQSKNELTKFQLEWPTVVPREHIFECLTAYREGTVWTTPPVCAVCSQYSEKMETIGIDQDVECSTDFEALQIQDEFIIRQCIVACNSAEFLYQNSKLDGLMLDKRGVENISATKATVRICTECRSSLAKSKIPRFALANKLYRGILPVQFQDLTWVEEMVCAIYRNTAHITRLYGSSDPSQPTVLHGNTCAHDMNIISTAAVLPRMPTDINDMLSIVFIGTGKLRLESLKDMFRVRKARIWEFLMWLKSHNRLYMCLKFDEAIMNLYPDNGMLPGLEEKIIQDHELDAQKIFDEETAGFHSHPATAFRESKSSADAHYLYNSGGDDVKKIDLSQEVMIEKMGVSDPESEKSAGRSFTAAALRNLVKDLDDKSEMPDLAIHYGTSPVTEYNNPDLLPGMFPTLFPFGIGGFDDKTRTTALSFQQQAQYYFNISDRSFRYHYSYMFIVLNIWQRRLSHLHTSITVKASKFDVIARKLVQVSPETLTSLAKTLEVEKTCHDLSPEQKNAFELLKQTNMIASRVPGSQASKIYVRNEIRNYFGYFGLPHIYFTFNPCAAHSPIFQVMFGDTVVDLSARFPEMVPSHKRALRLAKDPVAAADFFQYCVHAVFQYLFGWDYNQNKSSEKGGILGKLRAFYGTSELTDRGSFHGHFLIWLLGGMNPTDLHQRLQRDPEYEKKFFDFFESIIYHHLPDVDVAIDPSYEPRIERPPIPPKAEKECPIDILNEWDEVYATEVKMCGEVLQRHVCRAVCHKYGNDGKCQFLFPHEIVEASYFDADTNSVIFLCRDATVNYFNPYILIFCRHNHDIKCILSGKGAKAAMFYITDYITKMDLKTYQSLTLLSRAVSRMPDITGTSPTDAAKTLLHKCLSQFTRQQQIHAQQAVRYLRGFGDGISSHKTIPMLSTLLLAFVRQNYDVRVCQEDAEYANEEDEEIEPASLKIQVDKDGKLVDSHQVHHYWYRADTLADLSFYDFCRCIRLERKSKSNRNKNTHETHSGVLRRHILKAPHPLAETHQLLEHTNEECGELRNELVPGVVGMSIPRETSVNWYIFTLAHFKPFSSSNALINGSDWKREYESYEFPVSHIQIMKNWNAIHECEDEHDAHRLQKQEKATAESKAMTAAVLNNEIDDDNNFNDKVAGERQHEKDFHIQQFMSILEQGNWLRSKNRNSSAVEIPCSTGKIKSKINEPILVSNMMKKWVNEIKSQESAIRKSRQNLSNPMSQIIGNTTVKDSELKPLPASEPTVMMFPLETEAPHVLNDKPLSGSISPEAILESVRVKFTLNQKQSWAFKIIANNFLNKCVYNIEGTRPLHMLMTGPGGTGKTHVVRAVKEVMGHYGSAHKIRFLAPTGSAASLIDGMTIHKGLGIKIVNADGRGKGGRALGESKEDPSVLVNIQNKTLLRDEWQHVEVALLDESSMLSEQLLCEVDQALRYAKECPNEWFGGIIMIFAGDIFQYPPVMGSSLSTPISLYGKQTDDEFKKRLGRTAWKTVDTVIELIEQQRMKSDPEYADAVLRLRTRECTLEDVELFNSRLIKSAMKPDGIDMSAPENQDAAVIVQTNILRQVLNMSKAQSNSANSELFICAANDKMNTSVPLSSEDYKRLLYLDFSSSKYQRALPGFIPLYPDMPVILRTQNFSTGLKITNGSQGYVRQIFTEILPQGFLHCNCVLVEFPDSPLKLTGLPKGYYPVVPSTFSFTTNIHQNHSMIMTKITRHQLPIQPAFAVTGHSAQGKSLPKIVASLHEGGFGAYVAASRAFNREGLCITHPVQLQDLRKPLGHNLYFENRRLKALEHNTYIRHGFSLGSPVNVPDPETEINIDLKIKAKFVELGKGKRKAKELTDSLISSKVLQKPVKKKFKSSSDNISIVPSANDLSRTMLPGASHRSVSTLTVQDSSAFSFQAGCQWSSVNYSCAYDVVFMSLYSVYKCQNSLQRKNIRQDLNKYGMLGDSLEFISQPGLQMTARFNSFRDQLRDYLSAVEPQDFPRYGPHGTSTALILERIFPWETRQLEMYGFCNCGRKKSRLGFENILQTIMTPLVCERYKNNVSNEIDLKEHLHLLFSDIEEPYSNIVRYCDCGSPFTKLSTLFNIPPPILYFELHEHVSIRKIIPSLVISLPSMSGEAMYKLTSIIYLGRFHFTCRFILGESIWTYDGRIAEGCPSVESITLPTSLSTLLALHGRHATAYIYRLDSDL